MNNEQLLTLLAFSMKEMKSRPVSNINLKIVDAKTAHGVSMELPDYDKGNIIVYNPVTNRSWWYGEEKWEFCLEYYSAVDMEEILGDDFHNVMDKCYVFILVEYEEFFNL